MVRSPRSWSTWQRLDAVGLALVVALAVWVAVFAGGGEGRPGPVLWLLAGMVVSFAVGRALAWRTGLVHRVVAVAIAGSVALTWPGILHAGGAPTGYANANATLTSLGVIAAIGAAVHTDRPADRRGWIGLAVALAAATALTGSVAGVGSLVVALALLGLSLATRWPAFAIVGGLIVVSIALGVTTAIALGGDPAGLGERAGVRGELWTAAADFARAEPLRGIGPGGFAEQSPVSGDADLRWAHHGYLQVAAEYGIPGMVLVLAVGAWLLGRLWLAVEDRSWDVGLGSAALAIVGLHGAVDYVWHIPVVMVLLAVLAGTAASRASSDVAVPLWE